MANDKLIDGDDSNQASLWRAFLEHADAVGLQGSHSHWEWYEMGFKAGWQARILEPQPGT